MRKKDVNDLEKDRIKILFENTFSMLQEETCKDNDELLTEIGTSSDELIGLGVELEDNPFTHLDGVNTDNSKEKITPVVFDNYLCERHDFLDNIVLDACSQMAEEELDWDVAIYGEIVEFIQNTLDLTGHHICRPFNIIDSATDETEIPCYKLFNPNTINDIDATSSNYCNCNVCPLLERWKNK